MQWLSNWLGWARRHAVPLTVKAVLVTLFGPARFAAFEASLHALTQLRNTPDLPGPIDDRLRDLGNLAEELIEFLEGPVPGVPTAAPKGS